MADSTQSKRSREETKQTDENLSEENNNNKRHKSYNDILSILEEEDGLESDPVSGSDIFTTLEQELLPGHGFEPNPVCVGSDTSQISSTSSNEEDDRSSVIRHLLEASDDELGIPSGDGTNGGDLSFAEENETNGGDFPFGISDGLWEFEDEAANYYSLLQAELFM